MKTNGKELGLISINGFGVAASFEEIDDMDKLFEYALTPSSKREDELKFRVRMLPGKNNFDTYLNQGKRRKEIFLHDPDETDEVQTIFTESEYNNLQQKYHDRLPKFDKNDPHFEIIDNKGNRGKNKWLMLIKNADLLNLGKCI